MARPDDEREPRVMTFDDNTLSRARPISDVVLSSPDALIAAIPYLLGFVPEESAILIWLTRGRIALTARVDLPPAGVDPASWPQLSSWLQMLAAPLPQIDVDEAVIVFASSRTDLDELAAIIELQAGHADIAVRDALRMHDERWWSYLCRGEGCCPEEGTRVNQETATLIAAEFTIAGDSPRGSRSEIEAEVAYDAQWSRTLRETRSQLPAWVTRRPTTDAWRDEAIAAILDETADAICRSACAEATMTDIRVRDTVLWHAARLETAPLHALAEVLRSATRGARPVRRSAVATSAGICSWLLGDGARAVAAGRVALEIDPAYSLAQLLETALLGGLPPQTWRECMADLQQETVRRAPRHRDRL